MEKTKRGRGRPRLSAEQPKQGVNLFRQYVDDVGGVKFAAERLNCSSAMVSQILNGRRGISPRMAARVDAATNGTIKKERLINWSAA